MSTRFTEVWGEDINPGLPIALFRICRDLQGTHLFATLDPDNPNTLLLSLPIRPASAATIPQQHRIRFQELCEEIIASLYDDILVLWESVEMQVAHERTIAIANSILERCEREREALRMDTLAERARNVFAITLSGCA